MILRDYTQEQGFQLVKYSPILIVILEGLKMPGSFRYPLLSVYDIKTCPELFLCFLQKH
jgi:hypothetical protein